MKWFEDTRWLSEYDVVCGEEWRWKIETDFNPEVFFVYRIEEDGEDCIGSAKTFEKAKELADQDRLDCLRGIR